MEQSWKANRQPPWLDAAISVALPCEGQWTASEQWVWERIIRGLSTDLKDLARTAPDNDREARTLGAVFLRSILFHEPCADALAARSIHIENAIIKGECNWRAETLRAEVRLVSCEFESTLEARSVVSPFMVDFAGSHFHGGADLEALKCQTLILRNARVEGLLNLRAAETAGNVELNGATLEQPLNADSIRVGRSLFLREMPKLPGAVLAFAEIGNNVQFRQSSLSGLIDLTGARIGGEIHMARAADTNPQWAEGSRFILRNASADAIAGSVEAFPSAKGSLDLSGFAYNRLSGLNHTDRHSLADASAAQLIAWLNAGDDGVAFSPGPYRALAHALLEAGHADKANRILYEMRLHETRRETNTLRRLWLTLSDVFIGHGYKSWRAMLWYGSIVVVFAIFGLNAKGLRALSIDGAGFGEVFRWLGFSLGNALPILSLDKAHDTFLASAFGEGTRPETVPVLIAWVFYLEKLLGFVILSYLAAGISGAATRRKD